MEYTIVSGETLEDMINIVVEHLQDGWQLNGAPFVVSKVLWRDCPEDDAGELVCQSLWRGVMLTQ